MTELAAPRRGAILVVEDRDDVRQGLAQLLELHGFLVADARSGEDALEQLTDLVLGAVPTIVVTASDLNHTERVGLNPDAWLDKPFQFDDLLTLVRRYVVSEGHALQAG